MSSVKATFTGSHGDALAARLDLPSSPPRAYVLFAHCFTCSKESRAASYIAKALVERGIALLRFDFTGLGGSEGEFENTDYSSNVGDLVAAADWMRREFEAPDLLIGHSLGGAAALSAAAQLPQLRAVVSINAPFSPEHVKGQFGEQLHEIERTGAAQVSIGGRPFTVRREFLQDLASQPQQARISSLGKPLLVLHAPDDAIVDIGNGEAIFAAAAHPKSLVALDRADHLLTDQQAALYAADMISAWAVRYLRLREERTPVPAGAVRVSERRLGRFAALVQTPNHAIYADEPLGFGGNDTGLSPYELLSAALGTCTVMTLRMYAERRKIPVERIAAEVEHAKVHAADCAKCEATDARIDRLQRRLTLEGDLTEEQRQRLLEIADKCPVHRTLEGEIAIETDLVP